MQIVFLGPGRAQVDEAVVAGGVDVQVGAERAGGVVGGALQGPDGLRVQIRIADLEGAGGDVRAFGEQFDLAGRAGGARQAEPQEGLGRGAHEGGGRA